MHAFPVTGIAVNLVNNVWTFFSVTFIFLLFLPQMRQLVAIVFADMSGYTAPMQENVQLAKAKLKRLKEVLDTTLEEYNGKILQYYGDGSLSIFKSAIDAVHCAIRI